MSNFLALDVETANADYSSICQIGVVEFLDGQIIDKWSSLIDPKMHFDPFNVGLHGITKEDVAGAPEFSGIYSEMQERLREKIVVHHGHFDRTAFSRCYERFDVQPIECHWLDNTKVVRRTWKEYADRGFGLKNLVKRLEIPLQHHDALSDATAAGKVLQLALEESELSAAEWLDEVNVKAKHHVADLTREGNANAPFFGEAIVFTGTLEIPRAKAANIAQELGFDVQRSVGKKTTFVCVGIQDSSVLAGYAKSSKHRRAEEASSRGQDISILSERDFWTLVKLHSESEPK